MAVPTATRLSGLTRRQIDYAVQTGRLTGYKLDQETQGYLVQLSDVLELPEPETGRPPKRKELTPEQLGHII